MRKFVYITLLLFCITNCRLLAQKTCCQAPDAPAMFAFLAKDKAFTRSHANPLPYRYTNELGKDITYKLNDGTTAHAFEIKNPSPTQNYLIVVHEWWGLNDYIKKESARFYNELGNVNVIAIDLYDNKVAATKEEAGKLMQGVNNKRLVAIIEGVVRYAGPQAKVATIGWCFGGTWSLQTALHADKQAVGCVMYYGQPETDLERLQDLDCSVLGIFASKDKWITPQVVQKFETDMKRAGKKLTVKSYNADHAFANPSNPGYSKEMAEDAHALALNFLRDAFGLAK